MTIAINQIYNEDCLVGMGKIPDKSIDCIITDPPYMVLQDTTETWDGIWDMETFAVQADRILKDNGYLFVFGIISFFHQLMAFTDKFFRVHFDFVWIKPQGVNFNMAKIKPMSKHEQIICLIKHSAKPLSMTYNYREIGNYGKPYKMENKERKSKAIAASMKKKKPAISVDGFRYPTTVVESYNRHSMPFAERTEHPTQKPLPLVEMMVRGFSNSGDVVLDPFLGSGTTAVACINTNRNYIGFEIDKGYFAIAQQRIKAAKVQLKLW